MDRFYEHMVERLKSKREELRREQEYFKCMVDNEIKNGSFEKNAMSVLNVMQCLKSEISELEHCKTTYCIEHGLPLD